MPTLLFPLAPLSSLAYKNSRKLCSSESVLVTRSESRERESMVG